MHCRVQPQSVLKVMHTLKPVTWQKKWKGNTRKQASEKDNTFQRSPSDNRKKATISITSSCCGQSAILQACRNPWTSSYLMNSPLTDWSYPFPWSLLTYKLSWIWPWLVTICSLTLEEVGLRGCPLNNRRHLSWPKIRKSLIKWHFQQEAADWSQHRTCFNTGPSKPYWTRSLLASPSKCQNLESAMGRDQKWHQGHHSQRSLRWMKGTQTMMA